jgi:hypothetical protein
MATSTVSTVIADIEPEGRELAESELAAVLGGVGASPAGVDPTSSTCGGCH